MVASNADETRPPALLSRASSVEGALVEALGHKPGDLAKHARYALGVPEPGEARSAQGAKRIRPCLVLATAEALGATAASAMPAAVAIELVHNFSLVHDDIEDRDETRHGRPTVWTFTGEAQAINVGDYLMTTAIQTVVSEVEDPGIARQVVGALTRAMGEMIQGQWSDIDFESKDSVPVEDYLEMIRGKTGAMLGAAVESGAIVAGASPERCEALREWGITMGLVFQARDDYLGTWGDPSLTGKPVGSDIRRRKRALPLLLGLEHPQAAAEVQAGIGGTGAPDVDRVMAAFERAQVRDVMHEHIHTYRDRALDQMETLDLSPASREEFVELVNFFASRER